MQNSASQLFQCIKERLTKEIIGHDNIILDIIGSYLAGGHVLIEGPPGTGKTKLIRDTSKILNRQFSRIQFTADLLPSDIIGTNVLDPIKKEFDFIQGPIFTNILLADEINRAPPRTQSALLEAMEEKQITVENQTFTLPHDFFVLATQNPLDFEGTFPLPEAQMDRFFLHLKVEHGSAEHDLAILQLKEKESPPIPTLEQNFDLLQIRNDISSVKIDDSLQKFIVKVVSRTRRNEFIADGSSVRGALAIQKLAKVKAAISNREFVIPEDLLGSMTPCLRHRIHLTPEARISRISKEQVIQEITEKVGFPK